MQGELRLYAGLFIMVACPDAYLIYCFPLDCVAKYLYNIVMAAIGHSHIFQWI